MSERMAGEAFYFNDGKNASSLNEFKQVLETMGDDEFYSHVTADRNDFAQWIEHSLLKKEFADKVRGLRTRQALLELVTDELDEKKSVIPNWFMSEKQAEKREEVVKEKPLEGEEPPTEKAIQADARELEHFATREFAYGVILGFLVGLIIMAVLIQLRMLPY